jgi:pimeloyl-ACP methyl ester carboxylesterase
LGHRCSTGQLFNTRAFLEAFLKILYSLVFVGLFCLAPSVVAADDVVVTDWQGESATFTHGSVDSNGVEIEIHESGEGPLVIFLSGVASPWFDYRNQLPTLSNKYHVVAMSTRGTQGSDKPSGYEHYATARISDDVSAIIKHVGVEKATIVGQDSGGLHAWHFAMTHPEQTERLISLGSIHPAGLIRELIDEPRPNSAFQWNMQENPTAASDFYETLNGSPPLDPSEPANLVELRKAANENIDPESIVGFYKSNWPARPVTMETEAFGFKYGEFPPVTAPTLLLFGNMSPFFTPPTLNDIWEWVEAPLTIQVLPGVGHGPHREAPEIVTARVMEGLETGR